ncbi:MAG TPA: hypothetical protein DDZ88_13770 [Verrucomicrobiales bacterium]|nr:hypothetical protein [Verrucomicrobiales bacterium]
MNAAAPTQPAPYNKFWEESPRIPPIARFVWLGGRLPRFVGEFVGRFRRLHPNWEVVVHQSVPLDFPERWHRHLLSLKSHASRSDWVRLWLIHRLGGFYLDTDLWAFRPFDELRHYRFLALGTGKGWSNNALFAEAAGGPVVAELIRRLETHTFELGNPFFVEPKSGWRWSKYYSAGPALFTMAGLERPDLFHLSPAHWFQGVHKKEVRLELVRASDADLPALLKRSMRMPDGVWPFGLHCGSESDRLAFPDPEGGSPRALKKATAILKRLPLGQRLDSVVVGDRDGTLSGECLIYAPRLHLTIAASMNDRDRVAMATQFAAERRVILPVHPVEASGAVPDNSMDVVFVDSHPESESMETTLQRWWPKLKPGGWLGGSGTRAEAQRFAESHGHCVEKDEDGTWFLPVSSDDVRLPVTKAMNAPRKTALLTYRTGNIGDDVQSLSLSQPHLLGKPDLWIDRDQFSDYANAGEVDLVANGFFLCASRSGKLAFPPPPNISTRYVALCASNVPTTKETIAHFRASGPVGCRDLHSVKWCKNRGLEHYFASCPSCLLERDFDAPGKPVAPYDPNGPIVLVDVNPKDLPPFGVSNRPFLCLTNRVRPGDYRGAEARLTALRRRLRVLRSAALVITNRLHVAMPCVGLGVPVVMVEADSLAFRLSALPPWLKIHRKDELRKINLNPARHHTDDFLNNRATWRSMVRERLEARLALG